MPPTVRIFLPEENCSTKLQKYQRGPILMMMAMELYIYNPSHLRYPLEDEPLIYLFFATTAMEFIHLVADIN